jgi:hypothetical protein
MEWSSRRPLRAKQMIAAARRIAANEWLAAARRSGISESLAAARLSAALKLFRMFAFRHRLPAVEAAICILRNLVSPF